MHGDDVRLSRSISPPARRSENNRGLRSLHVGRLADSHKAVVRISLRRQRSGGYDVSVFCEPCTAWFSTEDNEFPVEWRCPTCRRVFEMEFAILEEVEADEERQ